jgi:foldase protein PrsA
MPEESKAEKEVKTTKKALTKRAKIPGFKKNKKSYLFVFILLLIAAILYFFRGLFLVALVNNKPITRLALVKQLEKESGEATLENLIVKELIMQEAKKKGVSVSEDDIQKEIEGISEIIEAQGETLDNALAMQGQTLEDLRDNIRIQKTAEQILKDEITVTNEEVISYFEENSALYEDQEFADLEGQIREQLSQQKLQTKFAELLENLKSGSDIIYLKSF